MDSLPKEMLLKIIGDVKLENLPNEVLIHMIHEKDAKISHYQTFEEKYNNLLKKFQILNSEHSELQEQHELLEKMYEDRNIEIKQLQQEVRQRSQEDIYGDNLPHQNGKYLYMNRIQADFDFSKISEKELKNIKKKNLLDFIKEKCEFTDVLINNCDAFGTLSPLQAHTSCRVIWREYRNWLLQNNIIPSRKRGLLNVFAFDEFCNRLTNATKKAYPNIEYKNGDHKSKFGHKDNPRVFIKLKN
jgi:hypothetical protein